MYRALALFSLVLTTLACADDSTENQGASGSGGDVGAGAAGGLGGSGGSLLGCDACDDLCLVDGCDEPSFRCEVGMSLCDGLPSGPICGCNGETLEAEYGSCEFGQSETPFADAALCQTGTFLCGPSECVRNAEVCIVIDGGAAGEPTYECRTLNEVKGSCSTIPSCECIGITDLCNIGDCDCTADADHQETISIPAAP